MRVSILDTDAFYCTNMERITEGAGPATVVGPLVGDVDDSDVV